MTSKTFSHPVRLSTEYYEQAKQYATANGMSLNEAIERLLKTAFGRLAALARYSGTKPGKVPARAAKKAPKKTSKKTSKKAAKKTSKKPTKKAAKKTSKKPAKKMQKKASKKPAKKIVKQDPVQDPDQDLVQSDVVEGESTT